MLYEIQVNDMNCVTLEGVRVRGRLATAWGGAVRQSQDGHFTWPPHRCTNASAARALYLLLSE